MKLSVYALFATLFWVSTAAFAQDEEPLKRDWLAQDIKALQLLARLQPVEAHTLEDLKCIWGKNTGGEERELVLQRDIYYNETWFKVRVPDQVKTSILQALRVNEVSL
jgi:hypothetical protein